MPCIRNAPAHAADQVAQITASIAEFGVTNPILIGAGEVIIAGHGHRTASPAPGVHPALDLSTCLLSSCMTLGDPAGKDGGKGGVGLAFGNLRKGAEQALVVGAEAAGGPGPGGGGDEGAEPCAPVLQPLGIEVGKASRRP